MEVVLNGSGGERDGGEDMSVRAWVKVVGVEGRREREREHEGGE